MRAMAPVSTPPDPARSALREMRESPGANAPPRASSELAALLARFDLVVDHPPACHAGATAWLAAPGLDDPQLRDLEHLPFVTMDNDDSRDLDQALFIEAAADGHVVWYALADASYYVRPGSALFAESLVRGASYYLPGLVVPMLPPSLSEGLVSLNEAVPRRALVFRMALDATGEVTTVSLERARIRSRKKLSYRGVQLMWEGVEPFPEGDFKDSLLALRIVGAQRIALAEAQQVVRYQRVEVDVGVTPTDGFVAFEARRYETDRCNEQISLLVNVEGARLLARHVASAATPADPADATNPALQAVFRVHPAPLPGTLKSFARMTKSIASAHREPLLAWSSANESLAHWLERIANLPLALRGVVLALQRQALLLNQAAMFTAEPGLHYGVGAPCYARFTSPMREVVGIFTHKEALEIMGLSPAVDEASDETTRTAVIAAANRAKDVQHQLTKAANQFVIADMLGADLALPVEARPRRLGTLVGLAPDRAYVVLDDPPLELKIYARDLGTRPQLSTDASALTIEREDRPALTLLLGDRLTLVAGAYDATRDRFVLTLE